MKKQLLLPFLFVTLLLAGCLQPNDEVDFPEPAPQKPVSELIKGKWDNYATINIDSAGKETTKQHLGKIYNFYLLGSQDWFNINDEGVGPYTLTKSKGKNYIEWVDFIRGYVKYEITAISDSTMTWEMTDSLSNVSDESPQPSQHYKLKFSRKIGVPFPKRAEGFWKTETTTKVTSDASGNIINTEAVANETKGVDMYGNQNVFVYWNENKEKDGGYYYMLNEDAGKTNLNFYDNLVSSVAFKVEVTSITDSKMTWKKIESPTVSYVTEFSKLAVPETGQKMAKQIKGEWIDERYSIFYKYDDHGRVIGTDTSYLHYVLDGRRLSIYTSTNNEVFLNAKYSTLERDGESFISILEDDPSWGTYKITQVSDTSMTWTPANRPFMPENTTGTSTIVLRRSR